MRFRGTAILLIVFVLLGGYVYFTEFRGKEGRIQQEAAQKKAVHFEPADVAELTLTYGDNRITGVKKGERQWEITNPPGIEADPEAWDSLARGVSEIQRETNVAGNASDLAPFGLDKPALEVSVKLANGSTTQIQFGSENPGRTLSYIKISDNADVLLSPSKADTFKKSLTDLRDKKVLDVAPEGIDSVSIQDKADPSKSLTIQKSGNDWMLKQPLQAKADASEIATLLSTIQFARATGFAEPPVGAPEAGLAPPALQLTLHDAKAMTDRVLLIGKQPEANKYYVKDASRPAIFIVDNQIPDKLRRPVFDWRDKSIASLDRTKLQEIEIIRGADKVSFKKAASEEDWKLSDNRKLQWDKISNMLNTLDFEKARDIIDSPKALSVYGLDKPKLEVSLTQNGGETLRLAFGASSQTPAGIYLKSSTNPAVVVVSTDVYDKFNVKVDDLVEKASSPGTPSTPATR